MDSTLHRLLLADDTDDGSLFREVLKERPFNIYYTIIGLLAYISKEPSRIDFILQS